jgi:hypothetical protein
MKTKHPSYFQNMKYERDEQMKKPTFEHLNHFPLFGFFGKTKKKPFSEKKTAI